MVRKEVGRVAFPLHLSNFCVIQPLFSIRLAYFCTFRRHDRDTNNPSTRVTFTEGGEVRAGHCVAPQKLRFNIYAITMQKSYNQARSQAGAREACPLDLCSPPELSSLEISCLF